MQQFEQWLGGLPARRLQGDACRCSGRVAASECCRSELRTTHSCSSPDGTVSGCRPVSQPARSSVDGGFIGWPRRVVVTRLGHRCRVTVEQQALVQHDAEDFQLVGHRPKSI